MIHFFMVTIICIILMDSSTIFGMYHFELYHLEMCHIDLYHFELHKIEFLFISFYIMYHFDLC